MLGVRAVIAESYERIHRSNLVGMGILPLEFPAGESASSLGLNGDEVFHIEGIEQLFAGGFDGGGEVEVRADAPSGDETRFKARVRIDTPAEGHYYQNGGILSYMLQRMA